MTRHRYVSRDSEDSDPPGGSDNPMREKLSSWHGEVAGGESFQTYQLRKIEGLLRQVQHLEVQLAVLQTRMMLYAGLGGSVMGILASIATALFLKAMNK
jgi:hypothetical protein